MSLAMRTRKSESESSTATPTLSASSGLRIGEANSASEREADRVADKVIANEAPRFDWSLAKMSILPSQGPSSGGIRPMNAPSSTCEVSNSAGRPLDLDTRNFFEPRFGHDFSRVRIHTGAAAAESARALNAAAYTVGDRIVLGDGHASGTEAPRRLLAHELAHTLQQGRIGTPVLQRQASPAPELTLIDDFRAKFPAAAKLIEANPAAMQLVQEASAAGAKFGGFVEDGDEENKTGGRAYTDPVDNTIWVPKSQLDPMLAMRDFLFECTNAKNQHKYAQMNAAAFGGIPNDDKAAKQFAHDTEKLELEALLRLGKIRSETNKNNPNRKNNALSASDKKYDDEFGLQTYEDVDDADKESSEKGEEFRENLVQNILQTRPPEAKGPWKGKTNEAYYSGQFRDLARVGQSISAVTDAKIKFVVRAARVRVTGPPEVMPLLSIGWVHMLEELIALLPDQNRSWAAEVVLASLTHREEDVVNRFAAGPDKWWASEGKSASGRWNEWLKPRRRKLRWDPKALVFVESSERSPAKSPPKRRNLKP